LSILTEEMVDKLIELGTRYANSKNLVPSQYVAQMINPDTIRNSDAYMVVNLLIQYHKNWLNSA